MVNTMKDILQYVPYALFLAAIFLLLPVGVAVTFRHFLTGMETFRRLRSGNELSRMALPNYVFQNQFYQLL